MSLYWSQLKLGSCDMLFWLKFVINLSRCATVSFIRVWIWLATGLCIFIRFVTGWNEPNASPSNMVFVIWRDGKYLETFRFFFLNTFWWSLERERDWVANDPAQTHQRNWFMKLWWILGPNGPSSETYWQT